MWGLEAKTGPEAGDRVSSDQVAPAGAIAAAAWAAADSAETVVSGNVDAGAGDVPRGAPVGKLVGSGEGYAVGERGSARREVWRDALFESGASRIGRA